MKLPRRKFLHLVAGAAALPAVSRIARAQAYPTRPVRIIVVSAPGGAPDIVARLMAPWLSERLGQQFVVDNRPGGRGNIGTEAVVKASPDGYTILLASSTNAINAALYDRLNFVVVCSKRFWIPTRPRIGSPKVYPLTPLQRGVISVDEATAAANVLQKFLDVFEKARRLGRGLSPIEESQ